MRFIEHVYRAIVSMDANMTNEKLSLYYREKILSKSLRANMIGFKELYNKMHHTELSFIECFNNYEEERKKYYGDKVFKRNGR